MKWWGIVLVMLIFLAACAEPVLHATVITEPPKNKTSTEECICNPGSVCQNGECVCEEGTKQCNDQCIGRSRCCTDSDCKQEETCRSGQCTELSPCSNGEERGTTDECVCAEEFKKCPEQDGCIPQNNCCTRAECKYFERCVDTTEKARICITGEEKTLCRQLTKQNRDEWITINDTTYIIRIKKFLANDKIEVLVNNQSIVATQTPQAYGKIQVSHEGIEQIGGFCKEDVDTN